MFRFRVDAMLLGVLFLIVCGHLATVGPAILYFFEHGLDKPLGHFGSMLGTVVLLGVAAALRRKLPNYGSAPPLKDLVVLLTPIFITGLLALALIVSMELLTMLAGELPASERVTILCAQGLNVCVFLWCAFLMASNLTEFQRNCAWERKTYSR